MTEEHDPDADLAVLRSHVAQLAEHFDTVHVFVTRHAPSEVDGTIGADLGEGNWFARYGQVREWVVKREADSRREATED